MSILEFESKYTTRGGLRDLIKAFYDGKVTRPLFVQNIYYKLALLYNELLKPKSLSIGGGPNFFHFGWINFDEVKSIKNPNPLQLTQNCVFPIKDRSLDIIYSSHCLEHLDTPTVTRTLNESYRVLKNDGKLIIKLPDFDEVLQRWKVGDFNYFDDRWSYKSAVYTWKNRQVPDSLDYRVAMIFCCFWNDEYGSPFSRQNHKNESAYLGPPALDTNLIRKLLKESTPNQISAELRENVIEKEEKFYFNHQNAWSRQELEKLLNSIGFHVRSFSKEIILKRWRNIPTIKHMSGTSMYCWAGKK